MDEKFQKELIKRLDVLIKLSAASSMKDANLTEKIIFLNKSGFSPKEIADMLNTTNNYVSVVLSNIRKKKKPEDQIINNAQPTESQNQDQGVGQNA